MSHRRNQIDRFAGVKKLKKNGTHKKQQLGDHALEKSCRILEKNGICKDITSTQEAMQLNILCKYSSCHDYSKLIFQVCN